MASLDPSLISDPIEQKWVGEISEILKHQLEIDIDIPPVSIFQVPEKISIKKPDAYEPQYIGFGPNHHFRPGPYTKMQQKKILVLQRVLQYYNIKDFRLTVLDKVQKLVPVIRACYELFIQDDNLSMAWVFAIDGLFLLNLFQAYYIKLPIVDTTKRLMAQDIMMVENQIPLMVLEEIHESLNSSSSIIFSETSAKTSCSSLEVEIGDQIPPSSGNTFLPTIFRSFSEIHSPLVLCSLSQVPTRVEHLLDYMYRSIINNDPHLVLPVSSTKPKPSVMHDSPDFSETANSLGHVSNVLKKVPVDKEIVQLYEQTIISGLQTSSRHKITIPSASKLDRAGFGFHHLPTRGGVRTVYIDDENNICLPRITLNNDSEVILRNLAAYETLMANSNCHPLSDYVGLMCGLITNVDDVKLLKMVNIIKGDLGEDEIVRIFVGMSSSILSLKTKERSESQQLIFEVNQVYERKPRIKAYFFMKKLENWLLVGITAIRSFVRDTWKIVAFMASIVTVFMVTYQAYCDVYGCDKTSVMSLSHASS